MSNPNNLYSRLGASSEKKDVLDAIQSVDKGLYPGAFCKIVEDIAGREKYCSIFHADGAGTKSSLAYMYYKETNDISVFRGISRDAIVMNTDDMLCIGATGPLYLSNTIGRNHKLISSEVISTIINEYETYSKKLSSLGLKVVTCGGETADIGDLVRTLVVDANAFTSMKRNEVIDASKIQNQDVIVGLSSFGKASYEEEYNSGISSNGFTLARHGVLSHEYFRKYPECYDNKLEEKLVFFGKKSLTEPVKDINLTIGKALLSPTRTYAPILINIFKKYRSEIHGIIHNTGGGQLKVLKFGNGLKYLKDNLFKVPKIFEIIQNSSQAAWKEMYQVFNMGHRMEIYCRESIAKELVSIAKNYNIEAKVIGHCEKSTSSNKNEVEINSEFGNFNYS